MVQEEQTGVSAKSSTSSETCVDNLSDINLQYSTDERAASLCCDKSHCDSDSCPSNDSADLYDYYPSEQEPGTYVNLPSGPVLDQLGERSGCSLLPADCVAPADQYLVSYKYLTPQRSTPSLIKSPTSCSRSRKCPKSSSYRYTRILSPYRVISASTPLTENEQTCYRFISNPWSEDAWNSITRECNLSVGLQQSDSAAEIVSSLEKIKAETALGHAIIDEITSIMEGLAVEETEIDRCMALDSVAPEESNTITLELHDNYSADERCGKITAIKNEAILPEEYKMNRDEQSGEGLSENNFQLGLTATALGALLLNVLVMNWVNE